MQWQFHSVSLITYFTFILISQPIFAQLFTSTAPFNAPRISSRAGQSDSRSQSFYQPASYKLSPAYYSMNNIQNNNITDINPFGTQIKKKNFILNTPGYSNQFNSGIRMGTNNSGNGFRNTQFSRLNLGSPLTNLHQGKGNVVVLGLSNLKPNQSVFNGNTGNIGVVSGNVNNNVMIQPNGFPNTNGVRPGGMMISPGVISSPTVVSNPSVIGVNGSVTGGGMIPVNNGNVNNSGISDIKPLMVKLFFLNIILIHLG
jgi:hypothetical protein